MAKADCVGRVTRTATVLERTHASGLKV